MPLELTEDFKRVFFDVEFWYFFEIQLVDFTYEKSEFYSIIKTIANEILQVDFSVWESPWEPSSNSQSFAQMKLDLELLFITLTSYGSDLRENADYANSLW